MQENVFTPCGARMCTVKVLSYRDRNPVGTLSNPNYEGERSFKSLAELLIMMESLFDEIKNPQRTMKPRAPLPVIESAPLSSAERPAATFTIDVIFRQNASWQGNLVWAEQRSETQFRSALELIELMDRALAS